MIQDIAPHTYHNEYKPHRMATASFSLTKMESVSSIKKKMTFPSLFHVFANWKEM